ncbi:MAG: hypothetical protein JSR21_14920 [Proteobacteria bacterium]|nr:hypothetical protein [Pseudomonadota bacterium]
MHGPVAFRDARGSASLGAVVVAGVAAAVVFVAAAGWLPEVGAAQRAAQERTIETENAGICARLGLGDATPAHDACLRELRAVRQKDNTAAETFL